LLGSNINAIDGKLNIYEGSVITGYETGAGEIYFDQGILDLTNTVTLTNNMYAIGSTSTINIQVESGTITTLTGIIGDGTGNFAKNGMGTLVLSTMSSANAANAALNAGTMQADSANILMSELKTSSGTRLIGTGTITGNVTNTGTVRPGNDPVPFGTLTINGNYTENGNLGVRLDESLTPTNDKLVVNGNVNIGSGSLIDLDLRNGFVVYSSYMVVQSNGLTGNYSGFVQNYSSMGIGILKEGNDIYLVIRSVKTRYQDIPNLSHNQKEVERTLDAITARGDAGEINAVSKILGTADPLSDAQKKQVFDEVAGNIYANLLLMPGQNMAKRQMYDQIQEKVNRNQEREEKTPCTYNIWVDISAGQYNLDKDSNGIGDFKDTNGCISAGFDNYCGVKNAILGYAISCGIHDAKENEDKASINDYKGGVYFGAFGDRWTLKASVMAGYQQYDVDRQLALLQSTTKAKYNGYSATADAAGYYGLYKGKKIKVSPFAGLTGSLIHTDGFTEEAGGNAASILTVKADNFTILDSRLGLKAESKGSILSWYASLSGAYNLNGRKGEFEATLNGLPDNMTIYGSARGLLSGEAGAGLSVNVTRHINIYLTGQYRQGENFQEYSGLLGLNYSW
ncbi:MAG: autotransporter domain-containing protein, partial [Endomicrobia bacterium]|nr:autotransporter domain-containing protein [Endomicrobiia bacterium]